MPSLNFNKVANVFNANFNKKILYLLGQIAGWARTLLINRLFDG